MFLNRVFWENRVVLKSNRVLRYIKPGGLVRKPGGLDMNRVVWLIKSGCLVIFIPVGLVF